MSAVNLEEAGVLVAHFVGLACQVSTSFWTSLEVAAVDVSFSLPVVVGRDDSGGLDGRTFGRCREYSDRHVIKALRTLSSRRTISCLAKLILRDLKLRGNGNWRGRHTFL